MPRRTSSILAQERRSVSRLQHLTPSSAACLTPRVASLSLRETVEWGGTEPALLPCELSFEIWRLSPLQLPCQPHAWPHGPCATRVVSGPGGYDEGSAVLGPRILEHGLMPRLTGQPEDAWKGGR